MEKVTFTPNVPAVVTLSFDSPREVTSQFNDQQQYLYSTNQGPLYAPPYLHQLIQDTGAKRGSTLRITKRTRKIGTKQQTDWTVEDPSVSTAPQPPYPDPFEMNPTSYAQQESAFDSFMREQAEKAAAGNARVQADIDAARKAKAAAAAAAPPQPTPVALGNPLAQALVLSLDAAAIALDHAKKLNIPITVTFEDIRCMANTMLINREKRNEPRNHNA